MIWTLIELEEDIVVLNNVTKFHKILIKNIRLRERTSFQMMNFYKQKATEGMARRRHYSTKQCDKVSYNSGNKYST